MKPYIRLALIASCAFQLVACVSPKIEDDPGEKAKAKAVAEKFLSSFLVGNMDLTLETITTPFWGDGDVISSLDKLKEEVSEQMGKNRDSPPTFEVLGARFFTVEDIELLNRRTYERMKNSQFSPENMYAVALRIRLQDRVETGIIFVQRQPDGMWKVVGIDG